MKIELFYLSKKLSTLLNKIRNIKKRIELNTCTLYFVLAVAEKTAR